LRCFSVKENDFIILCKELGDPLLELRVDHTKKPSVFQLKKVILHCPIIDSCVPNVNQSISFISIDEYEKWFQLQPQEKFINNQQKEDHTIKKSDNTEDILNKVEEDKEEGDEDIKMDEVSTSKITEWMREKLSILAVRAKENVRRLSKLQKYQREIEKVYLYNFKLPLVHPVVKFYIQNILSVFHKWVDQGRPLIEQVEEQLLYHSMVY
jgi:hypothetical protein